MNNYFFKRIFIVLALLLLISSCAKSNEEIINDTIREVKPELPMRYNDRLAWVDLRAGKDEVIFLCEIRGFDQSRIDKETMPSKLKTELIPFLKSQKDTKRIFKRNIRITFVFNDEAGEELFNFAVSREDLGY
jgi:hypothetical protein